MKYFKKDDDLVEILSRQMGVALKSFKLDEKKMQDMEMIERELYNALADSKGPIREMCSHILNAGGKRIRPLLVFYSGLIFSPSSKELVQAAVAAELIHMASLVHDDIIDNSFLRRNKPSVNNVWGNQFAVLCGDYLFAKAFGVMSKNRLLQCMDLMVESIENMCHGEIVQAGDRYNHSITIDAYYERIAQKTAIFLQLCCKSGATISGANEIQIDAVGGYGLNLGLAFQIVDDLLDFCGDVKNTGKPKGEDLSQGNITLPVVLLLDDTNYGPWVRETIEKKDFSDGIMNKIIDIMYELNIVDRCYEFVKTHIKKAKQCLDILPESGNSQFLSQLADMLQVRAN